MGEPPARPSSLLGAPGGALPGARRARVFCRGGPSSLSPARRARRVARGPQRGHFLYSPSGSKFFKLLDFDKQTGNKQPVLSATSVCKRAASSSARGRGGGEGNAPPRGGASTHVPKSSTTLDPDSGFSLPRSYQEHPEDRQAA